MNTCPITLTRRRHRRRRTPLVGLLVVGLLGSACGSSGPKEVASAAEAADSEATPSTSARTLTGSLSGSSTMLGLVIDGDRAWGYLCDPAGAARAVVGTVTGSKVELTEPDGEAVVSGTLDGQTFAGTVALDGTNHEVTAIDDGQAEVFIAATGDATSSSVGAWIRSTGGELVGQAVLVTPADDRPADQPDVGIQPGGAPPADAVPALRSGLIGCFIASRRLVRAERLLDEDPNFGNAAAVEVAHNEYIRACGFGS